MAYIVSSLASQPLFLRGGARPFVEKEAGLRDYIVSQARLFFQFGGVAAALPATPPNWKKSGLHARLHCLYKMAMQEGAIECIHNESKL